MDNHSLRQRERSPRLQFNILSFMVRRLTSVGFIQKLADRLSKHPARLPRLDDTIDVAYFNRLLSPGGHFAETGEDFVFKYNGMVVAVDQTGGCCCYDE